jgi:hypothetical protein
MAPHRNGAVPRLALAAAVIHCTMGSELLGQGRRRLTFPLERRIVGPDSSSHVGSLRRMAEGGDARWTFPTWRGGRLPAARSLQGGNATFSGDAVELYGEYRKLAYFYAYVYVGDPAQQFTVITDTGSSLMAVPCFDCNTCGAHMDPKYDPSRSSSSSPVQCGQPECGGSCTGASCTFEQGYAEGSHIGGRFYRDATRLGDIRPDGPSHAAFTVPQFVFGCLTSESGLFTSQQADGIMGMGQSTRSLVRSLFDAGRLERSMFSLCLTMDGGALTVGDVDTAIHTGPLVWAGLEDTGFYSVTVAALTLGDRALPTDGFNRGQKTILDSGTTFTYVPPAVFGDLTTAIREWCAAAVGRCNGVVVTRDREGPCWEIPDPNLISTFPTLTFTLQGWNGGGDVPLAIEPRHLFVPMTWTTGAYCLAVYPNSGGSNNQVLGANAMMGRDVVFDTGRVAAGYVPSPDDFPNPTGSWRVGFAPSECRLSTPTPVPPTPPASPSLTPPPAPCELRMPLGGWWGGWGGGTRHASICPTLLRDVCWRDGGARLLVTADRMRRIA